MLMLFKSYNIKAFVFLGIIAFSIVPSLADKSPLANANSRGLDVRSMEDVLRLNADEIDLGTAILITSEQWNDNVLGKRYLAKLDEMAYEIRDRIKSRKVLMSHQVIDVINSYLFDEMGFKAVSDANDSNNLFLHCVLDRKQGYCLSLSMLYLALGERLGVPVYGVVVPGHFFVRYDNGRIYFNIETTNKGRNAEDSYYIDKFKVPENSELYMTKLDKKQSLGCFFNNLGNSYVVCNNIKQARLALERSVELAPMLSEAWSNLGNIYLRLNYTQEAINAYKGALKINPNDAKTYNNLGNAYIQLQWFDSAIGELRKAIDIDPQFNDAYKNMAIAYCRKEAYDWAIPYIKKAMNIDPNDTQCYILLGEIYFKTGNYSGAINEYNRALQINPKLAKAYFGIGVCYNKLDRQEEEIKAFTKALEIEPKMTIALLWLGNVYFTQKDYRLAGELYEKAAQTNPNDSAVYFNIGAAFSNLGDYKKAVPGYEKAIELDPKLADAHKGLAYCYYQLRDYKLAWEHLQKAKELGAQINKDLVDAIEQNLK